MTKRRTEMNIHTAAARPADPYQTRYHRDRTVTYWSVYEQVWRRHAYYVPDRELAACSAPERHRIIRHLDNGERPNR